MFCNHSVLYVLCGEIVIVETLIVVDNDDNDMSAIRNMPMLLVVNDGD